MGVVESNNSFRPLDPIHCSNYAKDGVSLTMDPTHPARSKEERDHGTRDIHASDEDIAFGSPGVFGGTPPSSPTETTTHSTISKEADVINQSQKPAESPS